MQLDYHWYVVAESREIRNDKPTQIRIFDTPVAVYRTREGKLVAMHDVCPHLGASLSLGSVVEDRLQCPYHAIEFAADGHCTSIPQKGPNTRIPKAMCTQTFEVRERGGFVFLYWGEASEDVEDPEFFEELGADLSYVTTTVVWNAHLSRVMENQLDSAHVKTIHRKSIGRVATTLIEKELEIQGNFVRSKVKGSVVAEQYTKMLYPNLWINRVNPRLVLLIAAVPLDDGHTKIYLRTYQGFVTLPLLSTLMAHTLHLLTKRVLSEDEPVATTQLPRDTADARGEKLMDFDNMIITYRRMRKDSLRATGHDSRRALPQLAPIRSDIRGIRPLSAEEEANLSDEAAG